jgi:Zn ribbon nucleic-acid-binding protein
MALIACPKCNSEDITGTPQADSRLLITCANCGHEWLRGEARRDPGRPAVRTIDSLHAAFPTVADVRPDVRERVQMLQA